ncbi:PaaI family thioesterase [Arundinibacter roseus]|uniref:PaaI family thioesterase n=1 Tax=Arundinibacter roseus TaxID=2070510 RepID=A0A4R4KBF7_9BACT|nr:PaaI family thioesterase [Arundinibacter roseus]TDB64082.1 PaaI family thioesterase [Arundinibacter roseus]
MITDPAHMNPRLEFFRTQLGNDMSSSISPMGRWLNGIVRKVEYGQLSIEFTVREDMTNPMGVLHGGAASAMMDDVVGAMVFALGREFGYTSVNLNCDFLSPARLGDVLTAHAQVVRAGKNIIHCACEIVSDEGKIIAKCATNLVQTGIRLPV